MPMCLSKQNWTGMSENMSVFACTEALNLLSLGSPCCCRAACLVRMSLSDPKPTCLVMSVLFRHPMLMLKTPADSCQQSASCSWTSWG